MSTDKNTTNLIAVYKAIEECNLAKVLQLLTNDPKLFNSRNKENDTPLHIAVVKDSIGPQTDYRRESSELYLKIAKLLISLNADINARNAEDRTPLHVAVVQGHFDMAALLLSNGADPNAQDKYGSTPMHIVYEELLVLDGHMQMITLLLLFGTDMKIQDNNQEIPLEIFKRQEEFEVVEFLTCYLKWKQ